MCEHDVCVDLCLLIGLATKLSDRFDHLRHAVSVLGMVRTEAATVRIEGQLAVGRL